MTTQGTSLNNRQLLVAVVVSVGMVLVGWAFMNGGSMADSQALDSSITQEELEKRLHNKLHNAMVEEFRLMNEKSAKRLYPPVKQLPEGQQKRILVTGGAGFVGSHLVDVLMTRGEKVYVLDNLFTGRFENIEHWDGHPNFRFFQHDVTLPFFLEVDQIYHLACPASPPHYQYNPIKTIKTSTHGTLNMLGLAKRVNARLLFTSTSEVYGDPEQHPQRESYRGNVNTMGPRACYDEGKRVGETLCYSYQNQEGVEVRIARIFNTAGPRMSATDGRVVSNFILQSIENKPITVYGRGDQTRSFQYVSDLVRGLYMLMNSDYSKPINLGNPDEYTIGSFAEKIRGMVGSSTPITHEPPKLDDPQKRKPDITTALCILGWEPLVSVDDGMSKTIAYFKSVAGVTQARTDPLWMTDAILEATAEQQAAIKAKQKEKCPSWRDSQQSEL